MSWLKNFVTGGDYNRLQDEQREFNQLAKSFSLLQDGYIDLNNTHLNALQILKKEREEVVKNLSLAKNLISKVKAITNDKKQEVKNDFITYVENENIEFQLGDVSINFQGKLDNVSETFVRSLDSSFKRLENKKNYTKGDLKSELAIVAVETLIKGVAEIINLNGEVNEKRRHITESTRKIKDATSKMTNQAPKIYIEVKRMMEIAEVLNKHNQVFSIKYQAIQKEISKKSKFSIFINELINKKIVPDETMQMNLHSLMKYSSEYSRFNTNANI
ncbi:MAG: hypothetical protein ACI7YS_03245 [Flavobacterium sp.]